MPSDNIRRFGFNLSGMPWRELAPGLREKSHDSGKSLFRLVEFSAPFTEQEWCTKQHAGFVLQGEIVVNVDGQLVTYRQGDVIALPSGVRHRHDTTVKTAQLFLIENSPARSHDSNATGDH